MMKRILAAVCVVLVALSPVAGALSSEVVNLGASHGLATDDAVAQYEEDGLTSTTVDKYQLSITAAEDSGDVGLESWKHSDTDHSYVRLQYNESIERTFRFYLPSEMVYPHVQEGIEAENADVTMDLEPAPNSNMTAATVHLDGKTDAVFKISSLVGGLYYVKGESSSFIENVTGMDMPSLTASSNWQYLNDSKLSGNETTAAIVTDGSEVTVQYDSDQSPTGESWLGVPECNSGTADDTPVCTFTRENSTNVYVLSKADDPPRVRYQEGGSITADLNAAINDLRQIPDRIMEDINSIFGGDSA